MEFASRQMVPATPQGLASDEVRNLLAQVGPNTLGVDGQAAWWRTLLGVVREPMVLMLLVCAGVYVVFGDLTEALILGASVVLVVVISLVQERRTERALQALKDLSSPLASVRRDGRAVRVKASEVVPGDVLLLQEGDRVAADAVVVSATGLKINESLLTGESVAVRKRAVPAPVPLGPPGEGITPFVYASTLVVSGRAEAVVGATGARTEVGRIGRALETVSTAESPLNRQLSGLVRALFAAAILFCITVLLVYGLARADWKGGLLAGLTLAISLLPEEFPVVMAVFLALGAYRMTREKVLVRRLAALETLGAATVLCSDKTGTLTENRMKVVEFTTTVAGQQRGGDDPLAELREIAALACPPESFDAMDQATVEFGRGASAHAPPRRPVREYPLTPELPVMAFAHSTPGGLVIAAKGAPEAVATLAGWDVAARRALDAQVHGFAERGLRLLAVGRADLGSAAAPEQLGRVHLRFLGLLAFADPLRAGVPEAVAECRRAGVRVMLITGDHPSTAVAIARQAGIDADRFLTGAQLESLDDASLRAALAETEVFARVAPLHKLRLVEALQAMGEVVAMTGDGVNDAPALRASHIGVAMGGRGTDVAREAADLVVLDDNFVSIVGAIRAGRRIYGNLQKSLGFVLAVHVPIAGMAVLPVFLGWPMLFTPVHIVFLELIIDPACSIAFEMEPGDPRAMERPPRSPRARLMGWKEIARSLGEGVAVFAVVALGFWIGQQKHGGMTDARTLAFSGLIMGNLGLIVANRAHTSGLLRSFRTPNPAFWAVVAGAIGVLALVLAVPALRGIFHFGPLHLDDLAISAGLTMALVLGLILAVRIGATAPGAIRWRL
ncbi:MAG: cation-translocating P-type ATPase [Myxococcaceae bacterium]|nr:MAG: cation-translocating P-type ATPase [Myxococcaceae bacterium]